MILGDFSQGDFIVVLGCFALLHEPAEKLAHLRIGLPGNAARARRVFAMLDAPPEPETERFALPQSRKVWVSFGVHHSVRADASLLGWTEDTMEDGQ